MSQSWFQRISQAFDLVTEVTVGFPGGTSGKEPTSQCRDVRDVDLIPWVRTIPWRRAWQLTLVSMPGESHGRRSLVHYSP